MRHCASNFTKCQQITAISSAQIQSIIRLKVALAFSACSPSTPFCHTCLDTPSKKRDIGCSPGQRGVCVIWCVAFYNGFVFSGCRWSHAILMSVCCPLTRGRGPWPADVDPELALKCGRWAEAKAEALECEDVVAHCLLTDNSSSSNERLATFNMHKNKWNRWAFPPPTRNHLPQSRALIVLRHLAQEATT